MFCCACLFFFFLDFFWPNKRTSFFSCGWTWSRAEHDYGLNMFTGWIWSRAYIYHDPSLIWVPKSCDPASVSTPLPPPPPANFWQVPYGVYVCMRKLVPARVSYRDDFLISYRVYLMTESFHIALFESTLYVDKIHVWFEIANITRQNKSPLHFINVWKAKLLHAIYIIKKIFFFYSRTDRRIQMPIVVKEFDDIILPVTISRCWYRY